ncbi:MAG: exodeoxyribonuclease III [Acidimicrobiales bacterium]
MRIATWNVNSLNARMPRVEEWLALTQPDVLCMQETKMKNEAFPALAFQALGYESFHHGEGRWNGVAILSKVGLEDPAIDFDDGGEPDQDARICWATCDGVRVASAYIPNGREVDHDHYHYKLDWFGRLRKHLDTACDPSQQVAVLGDYNVAPEDRDVWDLKHFEGGTHITPRERAALQDVVDWGLIDVFRQRFPDDDGLYTYYDYQAGRFYKRQGIRIDLILATQTLADRTGLVIVDRNARKGDKPSDHCPLVAEFDLDA